MSWRDRIAQAITGIKAFHSSPYDFDRFDMSKIGTGQGAQTYGHGIYAAENPKVSGQGGQYWQEFLRKFEGTPEGHAASRLRAADWDRATAAEAAAQDIQGLQQRPFAVMGDQSYYDKLLQLRQQEFDLLKSGAPVGPRTYELNIKAQPDQFLKWDQPLAQQNIWDRLHPELRNTIDEVMDNRGLNPMGEALDTYTGRELYGAMKHHDVAEALPAELPGSSWLTGDTTDAAHTSAYLNSLGVPGISYADAGSRNMEDRLAKARYDAETKGGPGYNAVLTMLEARAKQPTSNYVVFDPGIIDITRKYGLPGAVATGSTMGALAAPDQYEVQQ